MITSFVIIGLCILFEAFFSGSEIAIVSVNRNQLHFLVEKGSRKAKALSKVLEDPEWLLGTTLLGTNASTITLNAVSTLLVIQIFGKEYEYATILITAPMVLFFGEVLPKAIFQHFADRLALELIYPLRFFSMILSPIVLAVAWLAKLFTRFTGTTGSKKTPFVTREELELMHQASEPEEGLAKDIERKMIDRVFSFSDQQAREIMMPLVDIVSISEHLNLKQAGQILASSGFSRLPVYKQRIDNVVGWVSHYDVLRATDPNAPISEIMREVLFVPSTIQLGTLLIRMQKRGDNLVMIVDEYGGVVGMLTLEDVLEEVVGDIEDEFDSDGFFVKEVGDQNVVVHARISIEQLNDILPLDIPEGDYETLAGYLNTHLQRIPQKGESITLDRMEFAVRKGHVRGIEEVEIRWS